MQQYLLNTTAIWLISLVLFDVFLRRETYHAYNRFYLLFTFLLGALLPLLQFQDAGWVRSTALAQPMEGVIRVKHSIVAAATSDAGINWENWPWVIYGTGAVIALSLLLVDIVKLSIYYRNGKKSAEDGWLVISTGKEHAPFSLLNTLYVSGKEQYTDEEWNMILIHERRHTALSHFLDLILMQFARIIFWFHPLVYIYNKRLLMVHEYQADNATAGEPQVYGSFLIEQVLLQNAPSITHSFNRSPIKNRLVMLTRKSSAAARTKMLVFIPLALVCFICFSKNVFSKEFEKKGDKVKYNGNTIELSKIVYDTIQMENPVTQQVMTKVAIMDPKPIKMNGKPVTENVDNQPVYSGKDGNLRDYLVKNMVPELSKLNDGFYSIEIKNILIDEKGKIAYFEYQHVKRSKTAEEIGNVKLTGTQVTHNSDVKITISDTAKFGNKPMMLIKNEGPGFFEDITPENQTAIYNKVCKLMKSAPKFKPGTKSGKSVISTYNEIMFLNHFKVKGHKVYDADKNLEYAKQL